MEKSGIVEFVDCLGSATDSCECTMTVNGVECDLMPIVIAVKHTCAIIAAAGMRVVESYPSGRKALMAVVEGVVLEMLDDDDE